MKTRTIYVGSGEENCPADALMADFRRTLSASSYAKSIEFSPSCIDFFRNMADIVDETVDNIRLRWYEIPEEKLPPLEVKIRCKDGKYRLMYLTEFGDEPTVIKGNAGKGRNKGVAERLVIIKRSPEQENVSQANPSAKEDE